MTRHPGGEAFTRRLIELAELPGGSSVLDMGAGAGESLVLLRAMGYATEGIDLEPKSPQVTQGNFLQPAYPDGSFDGVLSQCAFLVSGRQREALRAAHRLLRAGGTLMLADVFFEDPVLLLQNAGFTVVHAEDQSSLWLEYYLEALWRDGAPCCEIPKGKSRYLLMIGRKE